MTLNIGDTVLVNGMFEATVTVVQDYHVTVYSESKKRYYGVTVDQVRLLRQGGSS